MKSYRKKVASFTTSVWQKLLHKIDHCCMNNVYMSCIYCCNADVRANTVSTLDKLEELLLLPLLSLFKECLISYSAFNCKVNCRIVNKN